MIEISLISFRRLKPRKSAPIFPLEIFLSPPPPPRPPPLSPGKDSPRGANRDRERNKGRDSGGATPFLGARPHRGIHGSCRVELRACLVGHGSRFRFYYKAVRRISRQVLGKLAAGGALLGRICGLLPPNPLCTTGAQVRCTLCEGLRWLVHSLIFERRFPEANCREREREREISQRTE